MEYVSDEAAAKAREMVRRFQDLPATAGIIFVSVSAAPAEGGKTQIFDVVLGMSRKYDPNLGVALAKKVLEPELEDKQTILRISVYRGVSGAGSDRGREDHEGYEGPRED